MNKSRFFALVVVVAVAGAWTPALAQDSSGSSIGVGIESPLTTGATTGAFVYDAGSFHIDALFGFATVENAADTVVIGGRGWYAVHETARSDFSVGGGLELLYTNFDGPGDDDDVSIGLELGAKIRAFLTTNVAIHGVVGIAVVVGDETADSFRLTGQLTGGLGLTYFFN